MPCCTCCGPGKYMGLNQCDVARQRGGITEHPAVVVDLRKGHILGKRGLAEMFPIGSRWHYGPVYENMETHVRVIESPKQSSSLRDDNLAVWRTLKGGRRECVEKGPRTWFVKCEVISSKFHETGKQMALPPCALVPRAAVVWERNTFGLREGEAPTPVELDTITARSQTDTARFPAWWKVNRDHFTEPHRVEGYLPAYCAADVDFCAKALCSRASLDEEVEILRAENARLRSENGVLKMRHTKAQQQRNEYRDKLNAAREALR